MARHAFALRSVVGDGAVRFQKKSFKKFTIFSRLPKKVATLVQVVSNLLNKSILKVKLHKSRNFF